MAIDKRHPASTDVNDVDPRDVTAMTDDELRTLDRMYPTAPTANADAPPARKAM